MCSYSLILNLLSCIHQGQAEVVNGLNNFIDDIGIPMNILFDHAAEFLGEGTEFTKSMMKHSINWNVTESYSHWQNWAEIGIEEIKLIWKGTL